MDTLYLSLVILANGEGKLTVGNKTKEFESDKAIEFNGEAFADVNIDFIYNNENGAFAVIGINSKEHIDNIDLDMHIEDGGQVLLAVANPDGTYGDPAGNFVLETDNKHVVVHSDGRIEA